VNNISHTLSIINIVSSKYLFKIRFSYKKHVNLIFTNTDSIDIILHKGVSLLKTKFAERLKELRIAKGITQLELAKYLDLSTDSTVSLWEKGTNKPNLERAKKLALLFDVSLDYLLGEDDEKGKAISERVFAVTTEELELLSRFRVLSDAAKQAVLNLITNLEALEKTKNEQSSGVS